MSANFSPESFMEPAARRMADAVDRGDVEAALAAAATATGGVNARGRHGETALLLATDAGDAPMVTALLRAGADPNGAPDKAPLHQAVKAREMTLTKLLLTAGADPNGRLGREPALYEAALIGGIEPATLLLQAGARIDETDEANNTAALIAATAEHWRMVGFLLDHGATVWCTGTAGVTLSGLAYRSRLLPGTPEAEAAAGVVARLQKAGFPYPPPSARDIKLLVAQGKWPPASARK